jgi:hypothetical protein
MRYLIIAAVCVLALAATASAQKKMKPWTEWSERDAKKILEESPWAHTQTETDTSEMFFNPTSQSGGGSSAGRSERGAFNQAMNLNYRIRFLSAKPIRAAFARTMAAKQPAMADAMKDFVERDFKDYIVIAVTFDAVDRRVEGPVMQIFQAANLGVLKNDTFLETKNGKRLFIAQYSPPNPQDGLGAKFIFPRQVDDEPFITPASGEVRFYSEVGKNVKLNMRFKVADMMFEDRFEY